MEPIVFVLALLVVQAALGALDTFVSHEWLERLPHRAWAARELALHAMRSALYAAIFAGLAWLEWHGAWSWLVLAVMLVEYAVTTVDSVVEDKTRELSTFERTNHMLLALNTGLYTAVYVLQMVAWQRLPDAVVGAHHSLWLSLPLTAAALSAAAWAVRDAIAAGRMHAVAIAGGAARGPSSADGPENLYRRATPPR
nr:hypothetical protein [Caldimonas sp.]